MPKAYSKKYLDDNKPKFPLLPQDDYILEIEKIEPTTHKKYHSNEEEKIVKFTFKIVSFRDGESVVDITGAPAENRKMFLDRPYDEEQNIGLGFMKDGTPSLLRQVIAYSMGQEVFDDIYWEWEELMNKRLTAEIGYKVKEDESKANKIIRFIAPKSAARRKSAPIDPKEIPVINEDDHKSGPENNVKFPEDNVAEGIDIKDISF